MAKKINNKSKVKKEIIILRPQEDEVDIIPSEIIEIRRLLALLRRNLA